MEAIEENRKLYSKINWMRVEQQDCAQKIETLKDGAYKVIEKLAVA
jgi:hypothetical protein